MTLTYRCDLPGSDNCSGNGQTIFCNLGPGTRITFGQYGRVEGADERTRAEWAKSWEAALSNLREVVDALK